jgi:hypothetical protein
MDKLSSNEEEEDFDYDAPEQIKEKSRRQVALHLDKLRLSHLNEPEKALVETWFDDNPQYLERSYHD